MRKILFSLFAAFLICSCGGKKDNGESTVAQESAVDTTTVVDTAANNVTPEANPSDTAGAKEANEVKKDDATAKYDSMLDKYESLINKCNSLAKKGLTINDEKLTKVWSDAGQMSRKLDSAKKKMTPEQQSRLKSLDKKFQKFCLTQPA